MDQKYSPARNRREGDRIKVVVIDDHPVISDAVGRIVSKQLDMDFCGAGQSAPEAYDLVERHAPDVAVVDIGLRDAHGLDLIQNLRVTCPGLAVVVFSMYDESVYAERAIRAGATGYVMKSEQTDSIVAAIRSVVRGEYYVSRRMITRILGSLAHGREGRPGFALDELTDREMEVYQMLGTGSTVPDIATHLNISRKTVETYRRRVKEKLGLGSVAELLQHAIQWTHQQSRRASVGA